MSELLKEEKYTIKLGGRDYELSPITLNVMSAIEDEFSCGISELQNQFNQKQATTLRSMAWILLKEKNPDITKEFIGDNVDFGNLKELSELLFRVIKESLGE